MQLVKKMIFGMSVIAGLALSDQAQAATTCGTTSCTGSIRSVTAFQSDVLGVRVRLDEDEAPSICALAEGYYWVIEHDDENAIKLVLAAYLAGKPIKLRAVDNEATCRATYVVLE